MTFYLPPPFIATPGYLASNFFPTPNYFLRCLYTFSKVGNPNETMFDVTTCLFLAHVHC